MDAAGQLGHVHRGHACSGRWVLGLVFLTSVIIVELTRGISPSEKSGLTVGPADYGQAQRQRTEGRWVGAAGGRRIEFGPLVIGARQPSNCRTRSGVDTHLKAAVCDLPQVQALIGRPGGRKTTR